MPFGKGFLKKKDEATSVATLDEEVATGRLRIPGAAGETGPVVDFALEPETRLGDVLDVAEDEAAPQGQAAEELATGTEASKENANDDDDMGDLLDDIFGDDGVANEQLRALAQSLPDVPVQELVILSREVKRMLRLR
jgi:hypothetical protein